MSNPPPIPDAFGPFQIVRLLGAGAMAHVYEVVRPDSSTRYALKVMRKELCGREAIVKRFQREIRLAKELDHPNLLSVVESGIENGQPWALMPLIEDKKLDKMIKREGPLGLEDAHGIMIQVIDALRYLHKRNLCHRDIKPENVLFDGHDVYLTDLGLAMEVGSTEERLTHHNNPLGTPGFMPLEQWRGESIGPCGDVFGAGVLWYYLLMGRLPYPGKTTASFLQRLLEGEADPFDAHIPDQLVQILSKAIAVHAYDRFADARVFYHIAKNYQPQPTDVQRLSFPSEPTIHEPPGTQLDTQPAPPQRKEQIMSQQNDDKRPLMSQSVARKAASSELKDARKLAILPVEFAENSYWVGKRTPNEIFYANPYLRCFEGKNERFNLLIDPGSSMDFSVVQTKCARIIQNMSNISAIFINHQDPDVASSVGVIMGRHAPNAYTMCTEDTWRLIQYHNISRDRFLALEKYPRGFSLPTEDWLLPVPSPFCHFVGAMMLYDPQTKVLYTGDLFGGLTNKDAVGLWADESDWIGMRAFHQIYMPTRAAVQHALTNIDNIDGPVEIIAPQHGRLIRGEWIKEFKERLRRLPVGLDIITDRMASPEELSAWSTVLERAIESITALVDIDLRAALLEDPELKGLLKLENGKLVITALGKFTVEHSLRALASAINDMDVMSMMKYEIIFATSEFDLPTPAMELDEDGPSKDAAGLGSMLGSVGID